MWRLSLYPRLCPVKNGTRVMSTAEVLGDQTERNAYIILGDRKEWGLNWIFKENWD